MKKILSIMLSVTFLAGCQISDYPFMKKAEEESVVKQEQNDHTNAPEGTGKEPVVPNEKEDNHTEEPPIQPDPEIENPDTAGVALEAAYFNVVKEVDGKKEIENPENVLALVNKNYALPGTYAPPDLIRPKVKFPFGDQDIEKSYMRAEAGHALESMFQAAEKEGIHLFATSGYRSYVRQESIFQAEVNRVGEEQAVQAVAVPGNSEHQTGLAMDITSESVQYLLTEDFELTPEGIWLKENAHRFGFILRYPRGKEDITGYQFEPWHFRYVGDQNAETMKKNDWTLEEFFQNAKKM